MEPVGGRYPSRKFDLKDWGGANLTPTGYRWSKGKPTLSLKKL
jgi:hypothetical protein